MKTDQSTWLSTATQYLGMTEAINGLLHRAKRMARGFRSFKHLQIYGRP